MIQYNGQAYGLKMANFKGILGGQILPSLSLAFKRQGQTTGKDKFYAVKQKSVNALVVLKLQCLIILLA